jgi:hypothetical protein
MIKGISPTGRYTLVSGGNSANPYISPGAAGAGMLRWNPNTNCMEVNDGNMWKPIETNYASVGLTPEAESLLDWARQKRQEELSMAEMMEKYPALKKARDNYDLIWNLVKDEQRKDTI